MNAEEARKLVEQHAKSIAELRHAEELAEQNRLDKIRENAHSDAANWLVELYQQIAEAASSGLYAIEPSYSYTDEKDGDYFLKRFAEYVTDELEHNGFKVTSRVNPNYAPNQSIVRHEIYSTKYISHIVKLNISWEERPEWK